MGVGDQLGLDDGGALLDRVRRAWPTWIRDDKRLAVVTTFDELRDWLPRADRAASDEVLLALAIRGARDGGDDVLSAAALAKCMLPAACRLAGSLCAVPRAARGAGWPVDALGDSVDQAVASQLWIECRSFRWRQRTKVAANILVATRSAVLRDFGEPAYLEPVDGAWARADLVDAVALGDPSVAAAVIGSALSDASRSGTPGEQVTALLAADVSGVHEIRSHGPTPAEELADVLDWACEAHVIDDRDRRLLIHLVLRADDVHTRNLGRGMGGLLSTELSRSVAPALGISEATVRRRASRSLRALAAAAPQEFARAR